MSYVAGLKAVSAFQALAGTVETVEDCGKLGGKLSSFRGLGILTSH